MAEVKQRWSTRWETLAASGVFLLALSLRLDRLGARNLWQDEAYSLDIARRTIPEILAFLSGNDAHPIGYYAMLSFWIRAVGEDLARMRALSVIFGLAAILLTWRLGRRIFSPAVGVGAAALLALNPFQIFASNELRMYMPLEFLALLSTWILWRAHESEGYGWWAGYGGSVALMGYVSYYAFLLVPAHALWAILHRSPRQTFRHYGAASLAALILYAPWISYLMHPAALVRGSLLSLRGGGMWPTYVPELFLSQTAGGYLFNAVTYHTTRGLDPKYFGMFVFPFVALVAAGTMALGWINRPARGLVALSWVVPVALVVLASLASGRVFAYYYHLNFLQPFLALFVAAGVVHLREAVARAPGALVTLGAVVAVLVFVAPAVDNLQWQPEYWSYRYDQAARLVKDLYRPGDVIVYLPAGVRRGFSFYFKPPGRGLEIPVSPQRWSKEAIQETLSKAAGSLTPAETRVWLVFSEPLPEGAVDDVMAVIRQQGYRLAIVNDFKGLRVGLFVRPVR